MILGWLPAVLVLGGRMYVRPETFTLLYLSIFLAVLTRIDRTPRLAFVLPFVQVAWVNTQGLFVFGPILWAFALLDAAARPGAFAASRARFWRSTSAAAMLTVISCLLNPYGLRGALYPLELARTRDCRDQAREFVFRSGWVYGVRLGRQILGPESPPGPVI